MSEIIDLGHGFSLRYTRWAPDRELNPQYDDLPDVPRMGAILACPHSEGAILFDHGEINLRVFPERPKWTVESWEPLTISPSVQCGGCGCHGFIRDGKWIPA